MDYPRVGAFLDGGSTSACAIMGYHVDLPLLAIYECPTRGSYGLRFHKVDGWLQGIVDLWRPRGLVHIGFEAPFTPTGPSAGSARIPIGMACKFEEVADRNAIECSEVVSSTMKLEVTGRGAWPKGKAKAAVQSAIFNMGYKFGGEHQADAIGVGIVCIRNWLRGLG